MRKIIEICYLNRKLEVSFSKSTIGFSVKLNQQSQSTPLYSRQHLKNKPVRLPSSKKIHHKFTNENSKYKKLRSPHVSRLNVTDQTVRGWTAGNQLKTEHSNEWRALKIISFYVFLHYPIFSHRFSMFWFLFLFSYTCEEIGIKLQVILLRWIVLF